MTDITARNTTTMVNPGEWLEMSDKQQDAALRSVRQVMTAFGIYSFTINVLMPSLPT